MAHDGTSLDDVDRAILYHLQEDARRTTNADISDALDVSATTVGQRIADLEERGVIVTHESRVDYERAGFPHRLLLFCTAEQAARPPVAEEVLDLHGVIDVRELVTGEHNLHVEIVGRTRDEIVDTIASIEDNGVEVAESELVKNEYSQPFDHFRPGGEFDD